MLSFPTGTKSDPKCDVTYGTMGHLDPKQPPVKRKPFAAILSHDFLHKVELVLPQELFEINEKGYLNDDVKPSYSRIIMPLREILEGQFFNEFIKKGNIMMLSEGNLGVENVFSLKDGCILVLYLDKESYERAGIVGKPCEVKGKRQMKPWWVVEINLRLPSMLHGKKGFERVLHAFKNVLTSPVAWLFHNLDQTALKPDPLDLYFPINRIVNSEISRDIKVNIPPLKPPTELDTSDDAGFEDYAVETFEWISMVLLSSPRIRPGDNIDPYLSRYCVPAPPTEKRLVKITWQGFISPTWAHKKFVQALLSTPREAWFSYSVVGFGKSWSEVCNNCTILKLPDTSTEYILWKIAQ